MGTLKERLNVYLSTLGMSVRAFERQCGIKPGTVARMTENSYRTTFHKISKAFPELNINWLKSGDGRMLNDDDRTPQSVTATGGSAAALNGTATVNASPMTDLERAELIQLRQQVKDLRDQITDLRRINEYLMTKSNN